MSRVLPFPESASDLTISGQPSLESVVGRFQGLHQEPDSPVRAIHHQPSAPGEYCEMPDSVEPCLQVALASRGIAKLYSHQSDALQRIEAGRHVVIVTPT